MRKIGFGFLVATVSGSLLSCSIPSESGFTNLKFQLAPTAAPPFPSVTETLVRVSRNGTVFPPEKVSEFRCLGINVVGADIPDSGGNPESAETRAALLPLLYDETFSCSYAGVTSKPFKITSPTTVELAVPKGVRRLIQVVGVTDPLNEICSAPGPLGSARDSSKGVGYFEIGRAIDDTLSDHTVNIRSGYSGLDLPTQLNRRLDCNGGAGRLFIPDGAAVNGKVYKSMSSSCTIDVAILSQTALPDPSTDLVEIAGSEYVKIIAEEGDCKTDTSACARTECDTPASGSIFYAETTYFVWDVSAVNRTKLPNFRFRWVGRSGAYVGTCDPQTTTLTQNQATNAAKVQIYKKDTWIDVAGTTGKMETDDIETKGKLADYLDGTNRIWGRVVSGASKYLGDCLTVQTDHVELKATL